MAVFNKTTTGAPFSDDIKHQVWEKGKTIEGNYKSVWRTDVCGNWIRYLDYGNRESAYGWEIDHIKPIAKGGTDNLSNLQPLHWENNTAKGDTYPWKCNKN